MKNAVFVTKERLSKEAINKVFGDLKARSKVQMKHFQVKMRGACYVLDSSGYQGTSKLLLSFWRL